jgi:prepilin signal peptidase PulO-like enzyme (type II secretory pathway)
MTLRLGWLWLIGVAAIVAAKLLLPAVNWDSLFGSLIGLAFGGGMVWSIRIVARYAMQREAMGFGDVTLMAMIGAFLGWQSALMTFAIAPFAALVIVFVCFLVTKESELAFGPYLCFGCLAMLFGWSQLWPVMARQFFFVGPWLFVILLGGLVAMTGMLIMIQWLKQAFGSEYE